MQILGITLVLVSVCVSVSLPSLSPFPCCILSLYRSEVEERALELERSLEAAQAEREKETRKHEAAVSSLKNDLAELRQVSQPKPMIYRAHPPPPPLSSVSSTGDTQED
jgi:hypothetical protein